VVIDKNSFEAKNVDKIVANKETFNSCHSPISGPSKYVNKNVAKIIGKKEN